MLRSFADASRSLTLVEHAADGIEVLISQNYPSCARAAASLSRLCAMNLTSLHARVPAHLHVKIFKR